VDLQKFTGFQCPARKQGRAASNRMPKESKRNLFGPLCNLQVLVFQMRLGPLLAQPRVFQHLASGRRMTFIPDRGETQILASKLSARTQDSSFVQRLDEQAARAAPPLTAARPGQGKGIRPANRGSPAQRTAPGGPVRASHPHRCYRGWSARSPPRGRCPQYWPPEP
jgi:hypothetical protein